MLYGAARGGNLDILRWATKKAPPIEHGPCEPPYVVKPCALSQTVHRYASRGANLKVLKWLEKKDCPLHPESVAFAAKSGNERVVAWLLQNNAAHPLIACLYAAKAGHFDIAQKLFSLKYKHEPYQTMRRFGERYEKEIGIASAKYGNIQFPALLMSYGLINFPQTRCRIWSNKAIKYRQVHFLDYLEGQGWEVDIHTSISAAKYGSIEMVKWVLENGGEWSDETMTAAAVKGHLDLVKWLKENGCPWSAQTSKQTAYYGKFEIFKWLIDNSCPLKILTKSGTKYDNRITAYKLIEMSQLKVLKFLRNYGLYLGSDCYEAAARQCDIEAFELLYELGCPFPSNMWELATLHSPYLNILEWLKSKNCPWNTATSKAAALQSLELFQWFVEAGCPTNFEDCKLGTSKLVVAYIQSK